MELFSVILNLITIILVSIALYIGYNIYRTRSPESASATEIFDTFLKDPSSITRAFMTETAVGPIGDFNSYDWESSSLEITPISSI